MADTVYTSTTAPNPKATWFLVPSELLDWPRFGIKLAQVLLSLVAFVQEEVINTCLSCSPLYFFEFVSCTALLFTLLLLILLSTPLHQRVGVTCWTGVDFCYTAAIFVLFIISSIVFSSDNSGTGLEKSSVAFGFLASVFFLFDVVLSYRSRGLPFRREARAETANGGMAASCREAEKLNTDNGV